ncbi:peptidoglycan-binding protein [Streptomyces sp. NPDC059816]|uniref:peptidoglycan-binding protein n=1 Tax=Streptomyces sp. NPDC059816 TaxID=3346960 RepID=UPI003660CEA3
MTAQPDAGDEPVVKATQEVAETAGAGPAGGLARKRRWIAAVAGGAVLLAGGAVLASTVIKSPSQAAAEEASPPERSVLTSTVEHRMLTSSVIVRGQVVAGQSVDVAPQVAGGEDGAAPVVTKVPVKQGDRLKAGQVLLEVSGRPVFALPGRIPVYRDLKPGAEGDDVKQLQEALRALGHSTGGDAVGTFGAGTKDALNAFYAAIGYDPLPATDDNGKGLKSAERAVTAAERALEEAKAAEAKEAEGKDAAGKGSAQAVQDDLDEARDELAAAQATSGPRLPAGEVVFLQGFPARVDAVPEQVGSPVDGTMLTVSGGKLAVQAYLQEHQKGLVRKGQRVQIYSELTGIEAQAKVGSLADSLTAPDSGSGGGGEGESDGGASAPPGQNGYLLRVDPDKALDARLAGQDVRLTIEAARTGGKALVVPITALTAGADGRATVTVLQSDDERRRVEVRTGTAGDGFVAVEPVGAARLAKGEQVIVGVKKGAAGQ